MLKTTKHTIETLTLPIYVSQHDIDHAIECEGRRKKDECAVKVAVLRALVEAYGPGNYRVKVTAGRITFNLHGFRWCAQSPSSVRNAIIMFDDPDKYGEDAVKPFRFKLQAVKGSKILPVKHDRTRQDQINRARRARQAAGKPDRKYPSLRDRIVGYA